MNTAQLQKVWSTCTKCALHEGRGKPVVGVGPEKARLIIIGEAPDKMDNETGSPLSGPNGDFFRRTAAEVGLDLSQAYITLLVACHPPMSRFPMYDELAACQPRLHALFKIVEPEMALLLGGTAATNLLGYNGITRYRGKWKDIKWSWKGEQMLLPAVATFHPGAMVASRNPEPKDLEKFKLDLAAVQAKLEA